MILDQIDYLIDGRNRRVGRKLNGTLQRMWLYQDGLNPVAELDGAGSVTARYVYGGSDHVPDYAVKGGTTYRLVTDHLGSMRLVLNASTGAIAERIDYDAWGRVTADTSPGFTSFGFAGGIYDNATALVRFGARDYDPAVGRWTCRDPALLRDGSNLYSYSANDPVALIDPGGATPRLSGASQDRKRLPAYRIFRLTLRNSSAVRATSGSDWDMCSWAERAGYLTTLFRTGHALDLKNNYFLGGPRDKYVQQSESNVLYGVAAGAVGLPDWAAKLAGGAGARLLNGEPWSRVAKDWRTWGDQPGDSPEVQAGLSMYRSIWGR